MYNESFPQAFKRYYRSLPVAIRTIITINVIVFLVQQIGAVIGGQSFQNFVIDWFAFFPDPTVTIMQPWRLITYMFMHANVWHILFNMLWLWWMGRAVEETLGPRTLTVIYMGSGIGGALLDVALAQFFGINFVIGASGAVFGVMVAFAMLYPRLPIMLFLLPPIEARYIVAGLIALNILMLGGGDGVAHAVHLGGAAIGYGLMKIHQDGFDLSRIFHPFESLWYRAKGLYAKSKSRAGNNNMYSVSDVEIIEDNDVEQTELDDILEKISKKGYDGLTKKEKKKLFELSKKNN